MAKDIKIDFDNNDLAFVDGDLVIVEGDECVKQHIKTGLFILLMDWFLDITKGINWFNGFKNDPKFLNAQIKDAIKSVENVVRLGKIKFYNATPYWKVEAVVYTVDNDEIEINAETPIKG